MTKANQFGCEKCFKASAEDAETLSRNFLEVARLVDESHFIIRILACPHCQQPCVSVFTELIDWSGGDDAQYWSLVPLTQLESEQLIAQGEKVETPLIESLGSERGYLQIDFPTGKAKRVRWAEGGLVIGMHD